MKSKPVICAVFCILYTSVLAGWHFQNPLPTGNNLYDVCFCGPDTGYACGDMAVLTTTDGGSHWDTLPGPGGECIRFPSGGTIGFLGSGHQVFRTNDAGRSWQLVLSSPTLWMDFRALAFPVDAETGYAACAYTDPGAEVYKTTDGGTTWNLVFADSSYIFSICDMEFPRDCQTGYVLGTYNYGITSLAKTTDGGADWTWVFQYDTSARGGSISFPSDPDTGYYARAFGVLKTTNGGASWDTLLRQTSGYFGPVVFPKDPDTGFVLEPSPSRFYRTTNGGVTWDTQPGPPGSPLGMNFSDNGDGLAVGSNGLLARTTDRGVSWTRQEERVCSERAFIYDVQFPSDNLTGYACGELGVFLKTTDGGGHWTQTGITDTLSGYRAVDFPVDNLTGYLAGKSGSHAVILKTVNGGAAWDTVLTDAAANSYFIDIQFPRGPDSGYAVQYPNYGVWRTTDGGDSWIRTYPVSQGHLTALDFPVDATTGYVVGTNGTVSKTTDAGQTWTDVQTPIAEDYYTVQFPVDADTGYVPAAGSGLIYKTTDGGQSWIFQSSSSQEGFLTVEFPENCQVGSVAGFGGSLWRTTDGGANWIGSPSGCGQDLYALRFPHDSNSGWAVGRAGVIISTIDGGGGIEESPKPQATSHKPSTTIVRNVLLLPPSSLRLHPSSLLDISGRKVLDLSPGPNDVSRLSPGVYFVREEPQAAGPRPQSVRKVVVAH